MDASIDVQRATRTRAPVTDRDAARPAVRTEATLTLGDQTAAPPDGLGASLNERPAAKSLMQLRRAFDHSPRVQAQIALQRALNQHGTAPARSMPQNGPDVVQRARLNLRPNRTISGVSDWPHRPSSNVSGSQGQHLTAFVSFKDMILSHVRDRTVAQAANALIDVLNRMQHLPGGEYWYAQYSDTIDANKEFLQRAADDGDAGLAGEVIDNILSLRNKMPDTAIATAEQTWSHGEAGTSGSLEVLETLLRTNGGVLPERYDDETEANAALFNMWRLLDYQPASNASELAFDKTKKRVLRHVMQMRLSYPQAFAWLTGRRSWLMPYIKAHRTDDGMPLTDLCDTEIDNITEYVHGNL